ncbi:hypothetical protein HDC92_004895 [Pedobacter sp. AK017]|uniref:right-handed parallel beta-helix repeat-containing protein n=1 Tax=Pedobacter sp. AK017 TaxID=2723073 RepID=UPI00161ACC8F|nr:right-handed parallel beta-helix repeat-containing protein [Pedobacter sp. AK017]MBB5441188.1 hypothetical protein [Pedobacter sp. AK017]
MDIKTILFSLMLFVNTIAIGQTHEFYVSPTGSNSNNGLSVKTPFASLAFARDAVRKLKKNGKAGKPVFVYLRGGTYALDSVLTFTEEDSGTANHPITYMPYTKERVVISGGRRVIGWKPYKNGIWMARLAGLAAGKSYNFKQLYVDDSIRTLARTPDTGFYRVKSSGYVSNETRNLAAQFVYDNDDFKADWTNIKDIETVVYHYWSDTRLPVKEIDEKNHTVYFQHPTGKKFVEDNKNPVGARYFIQGVFEALDQPGEWYLNRKDGVVYYYPLKGEDMSKVEIVVPVLPELMRLEGEFKKLKPVSYINFKDLEFKYAGWSLPSGNSNNMQGSGSVTGSITLTGVENCLFENCRVSNISNYAFDILQGSSYNTIKNCTLKNLGAGGIKINGGTEKNHPLSATTNNTIADNFIFNYGVEFPSAVGVFLFHTSNNTVTHNSIHDGYYTGISIGGVWGYLRSVAKYNMIAYNHIYNIGKGLLSDMGAIYTLGVSPGTVIRNNLIHDIKAKSYGGWGIYCDEGSSYILIENNVVYNTQYATFNIHFGKELEVRNNIFCLGEKEQITKGKREPHKSMFFENNIVYWKQGVLFSSDWDDYTYKYYASGKADGYKEQTKTVDVDYNIYYNPAVGQDTVKFTDKSWAEWQKQGKDVHSLYTDPLFVNADKFDFRLKSNSPAFKLGFKAIDIQQVGPR